MNDEKLKLLEEINRLTPQGRIALEENDGPLAYELLSRKHDLILRLFGPMAGPTGTSLIDLAEALHLIGQTKEARTAIDNALSIYKQLDRTDQMRDRLEHLLIEICTRQGHIFIVESIYLDRIEHLRMQGLDGDLARAVEQDRLARLYTLQRRHDEALHLLFDSLQVFEQKAGPKAEDTGICCLFIARALSALERYEEAEKYGRRALQCAEANHGKKATKTAMAADELAVTLAFYAQRRGDVERAREALFLSNSALRWFLDSQGQHGKETQRSAMNNRKLKEMLRSLVDLGEFPPVAGMDEEPTAPPTSLFRKLKEMLRSLVDLRESPLVAGMDEEPIALPTSLFISHSYADREAIVSLQKVLPQYVEPVIFEALQVLPSESVSERIISGVLGTEGLISISSSKSNASPWTAFELDIAARAQKHMFRFDSETRQITRYRMEPRQLMLAHLYHPEDSSDVSKILRWLVDKRSFGAFHDPEKLGEHSSPPFSEMAPDDRDMRLFSCRSFGAIYVLFISQRLLDDNRLLAHSAREAIEHPRSTMICWLDSPEGLRGPEIVDKLKQIPSDRAFTLSQRSSTATFNIQELDDLMVRLVHMIYQSSPGDWFR